MQTKICLLLLMLFIAGLSQAAPLGTRRGRAVYFWQRRPQTHGGGG